MTEMDFATSVNTTLLGDSPLDNGFIAIAITTHAMISNYIFDKVVY
jgi:uncharacterized membrane protein